MELGGSGFAFCSWCVCLMFVSLCASRSCLHEDSPSAVRLPPEFNCSSHSLSLQSFCCRSPEEATQANIPWCAPSPWRKRACQGGFFFDMTENRTRRCPQGFYCPLNVLCIVPCPLGAYCVQSNVTYIYDRPGGNRRQDRCKKFPNITICCNPDYNSLLQGAVDDMESLENVRCGGPSDIDTVICPRGYYCPTTSEKIPCPRGHYCRAGSIRPQTCSVLSRCPRKTSAPIVNGIGLLVDVILLLLLVLALGFTKHRRYIRDRLLRWLEKHRKEENHHDDAEALHNSKLDRNDSSTPLVPLSQDRSSDSSCLISPKAFTLRIEFKNLSLKLKQSGRVVLPDVTGHLKPKSLTAIMGGSGAGKTTLLNTLSGKAYYGITSGELLINGRPEKISRYRSITGFVPQEDIMHRKLTVQEVLLYQGLLRLSGVLTIAEIRQKTKDILSLLGLTAIRKSIIGDEETRGISGGQRKRVNIGMELMADPTLLFLDEPTSGLDSVSSKEVCDALRRIAEAGNLTIAAVLHQPRCEIFNMFHEIILLQPGGTIAFQGTTAAAKAFFESLGYNIPHNVNPADFYLDMIDYHNTRAAAAQRHIYNADTSESSNSTKTMSDVWKEKKSNCESPANEDSAGCAYNASCEPFRPRPQPPFYMQLLIFLKRCFILQYRSIHTLVLDQFLVLVAGAGLGGLYSEVVLDRMVLLLCMVSLTVSLTSMLPALRCFGNNPPVFWRESSAGVNRVMYFLAVNIAQMPIIFITPLIFLSLFYTLISPRSLFKHWYLVVLTTVWTCHGIGYAISTMFNQRSAQLASVVLVLISCMLSGATPTLCRMDRYKIIGPLIYSLSYARWLGEALFEKEANSYPPVLRLDVAYNAGRQGYSLDAFPQCVGILFLFGFVARLIALLCLLFRHRGQQQ